MPAPVHGAINPATDALLVMEPVAGATSETLYPEIYEPDVQATVEERLSAIVFNLVRVSKFIRAFKRAQIETLIGGVADDINGFRVFRQSETPSTESATWGDIWLQPSGEGTYTPRVFNGTGFVEDVYAVDAILIPIRARLQALESEQAETFQGYIDALKGAVDPTRDTLEKLSDAIDAVTPDTNNLELTGIPTAPTAAPGTETTQVATTAFAKLAADAAAAASIPLTQKGAASGVATLDGAGKVPAGQLPSYVDDVIEAANFAALPGTGETGKIYVTLDNGKAFRWSGSAYVEIVASPGTTDALAEGAVNKYFTDARAQAALAAQLATKQAALTGAEAQFLGFDAGGAPVAKSIRSSVAGNLLRTTALGTLELLASDLPGASGSISSYSSRAVATAELPGNLNTGAIVIVAGGDGGFFEVKLGNYASTLAADPAQGLVFPVGLSDGSQGVYQRIWEQEDGLSADWFGIQPGAVDVTKWNQMIARLPGLQTRTVRLRAGSYTFGSKPAAITEVVHLIGAGSSLTYLERGYTEVGGDEVGFLEFFAELSRNSRLENLCLRATVGTTGGAMVRMGTPTDVINSWCDFFNVVMTQSPGAYAVGLVVDGTANDVSGGQGHRDFRTVNCFIFGGTTGDSVRFRNATNGSHTGLWCGGNIIIDGGGTALQNTQDFRMVGLHAQGTLVLRNCTKVYCAGTFNRVEIEATATNCQVVGVDRGGGVSNLSPATCQVISQNGSYGNFIYEGTHDFKGPVIFRGTVSIEDDTAPEPFVNVNYRAAASQGARIGRLYFNAMDDAGQFLTYAAFGAVQADITDGSEDGGFVLDLRVGGALTTVWNLQHGIYAQTATGGNKGLGTLNAVGLYENNVRAVTSNASVVTSGAPNTNTGKIALVINGVTVNVMTCA
ncbi:MAG: hypothetical protein IPK75_12840 [Acidobacteria bacterium]|nr:hypothetical protein [Acidobacteriota bacterium]